MSPKSTPNTSGVFQIDIIGSVTKKRYLGEFSCKIPTMKDQSKIGVYEAMLNGEFPVYLNQGVLKLHKWIAYLKYTLTDVPKFWKDSELGFELHDPNVVEAVYEHVLMFEQQWFDEIWGIKEIEEEIERDKKEAQDT